MEANHPQVWQWPIWTPGLKTAKGHLALHKEPLCIASLLHTKYKSYWLHGFQKIFPIIRKLMTDPQDMAKLDPKGTVGTIYAGGNKTSLYTKSGIFLGLFWGWILAPALSIQKVNKNSQNSE